MNNKIRIVYWITVLILLIGAVFVYAVKKPEKNTLSETKCSSIFSPECQEYLNTITKEGKYDEAIAIQEQRIKDNLDIIELNKKKIANKKWLKISYKDVEKEFNNQSYSFKKENPNQKFDEKGAPVFEQFEKDFDIISANNLAIRDIILDTLIISTIQRKELKQYSKAKETLLSGKKILAENSYFSEQESFLGLIDRNIVKAESAKQ